MPLPHPSFLFVIEHMMPLCMVISWVYSVAMTIQHIVAEKEHRLKEVGGWGGTEGRGWGAEVEGDGGAGVGGRGGRGGRSRGRLVLPGVQFRGPRPPAPARCPPARR